MKTIDPDYHKTLEESASRLEDENFKLKEKIRKVSEVVDIDILTQDRKSVDLTNKKSWDNHLLKETVKFGDYVCVAMEPSNESDVILTFKKEILKKIPAKKVLKIFWFGWRWVEKEPERTEVVGVEYHQFIGWEHFWKYYGRFELGYYDMYVELNRRDSERVAKKAACDAVYKYLKSKRIIKE